MEVVNNYKSYKKYLPEYASWRDNQDLKREKRLEYLRQNPDKMNPEDIQRGKILLHSIDVMDEYSQSNAEDMEVATQFAIGQVSGLASMVGIFGGTLLGQVNKFKNLLAKMSGNSKHLNFILAVMPSVIGMFVGTAATFPAIIWATKAEVSASRKGRFEAMSKDLKNPAMFAVLNEEQQKKVEELAKDVVIEDKEKKRIEKSKSMSINPFESLKTLKKYYKEDGIYKEQKAEFDKTISQNEGKFDQPLSEKQIKDAKRDQQILSDMVRRIDVASQDYAENAELATNTITSLALGTGGLVGWVSNKIMKGLNIKVGGAAKVIPWVVGASIPFVLAIYSAKAQKQASRIGRFKVKQEMLNNPAELVYVDEKDTESIDVKLPKRAKKPNIFKFFIQLVKDSKEYNKYLKTQGLEELKRHKAIEKIELTDEQIKNAKTLQMNVFKTFNKVDEKSQTYSESVEAMGEITKQGVSLFGALAAMGLSFKNMLKQIENPKPFENSSSIVKFVLKSMAPFGLVILPVVAIDVLTTKAQKKASRVADMLALKELEDYRHYADYSATNDNKK